MPHTYVKTVGPKNAKIFLVGEAPGKDEEAQGVPFVGYAGRTLTQLLTQAGINRNECLIGNVARVQPPNNNINTYFLDSKNTVPGPQLLKWMDELKKEIEDSKPNVVVTLGAVPLYILTSLRGIKTYRGTVVESSLVPGIKVIPTFHPQAVNWEWSLAFPTIMDLRKVRRHSYSPGIPLDRRTVVSNPSLEQWIDYCERLRRLEHSVSVDIESAQPGSHISRIAFSDSKDYAMSFELLRGHSPRLNQRQEVDFWYHTSKVLYENSLIFQNAVYDTSVLLRNHGAYCRHIEMDTLLAAHCCWPEAPRDLGFLGSICLDVPAWKHTSKDDLGVYNAYDACNTYGISTFLEGELKRIGMYEFFKREMSEIEPASFLQLNGIKIDAKKLLEIREDIGKKLQEVKDGLQEITKEEINFSSPKQLQKFLYIDLGLPVQYKRRKSAEEERKITTDRESLEKLYRKTKNPILKLLITHSEYNKLYTSFAKMSVSPEGRVHTSYNIAGSSQDNEEEFGKAFGRWSSSKSIIDPYGPGNLQNIPSRGYGRIIRTVFVPEDGYVILRGDYVQAEAVVVAYLINDQRLIQAFQNKEDVHKLTASMMFGVKVEDVTKEQRNVGKMIRHASNYSAGPAVLAKGLMCEMSEAKDLLSLYHRICPQLRRWHEAIQEELTVSNRTLTNLLGRKHRFLDRWGDGLFRSAYAYKPQSTVGDLLNFSLADFYYRYGERFSILLQLHDAFYLQCKEMEVAEAIECMRECMIRPIEVNNEEMVIDVDFAVGPNWGELEEVK